VELPPPPYTWISLGIFSCYMMSALEGAFVLARHPWLADLSMSMAKDDATFDRVTAAQCHLCCIYLVEAALAIGPGWCAMSPGWTLFDLLIHHVPYIGAVLLAFFGGHAHRWTPPMAVVLMTPANEGMFIATALGAPECISKIRRLFGFVGITLLWTIECWTLGRNLLLHWGSGQEASHLALVDLIALGGIWYHALLIRMYIKRWRKTRRL